MRLLPALKRLSLAIWTKSDLQDMAPLTTLTRLEELKIDHAPLQDLGPLQHLHALRKLCVDRTNITSVAPLAGLTNLRELDLSYSTSLDDVAPLAGLTNLQELELSHCPSLKDVTPLAPLTNLRELYLSYCTALQDVAPLAGLTHLRELDLSYCVSLKDVTPLFGRLRRLVQLDLPQHVDCFALNQAVAFPALRRVWHDNNESNCWTDKHHEHLRVVDLRAQHKTLTWPQLEQLGDTVHELVLNSRSAPRPIPRDGYRWLAKMQHLVRLDLDSTVVDATVVAALVDLPQLRELVVDSISSVKHLTAGAPVLCGRLSSLTVTAASWNHGGYKSRHTKRRVAAFVSHLRAFTSLQKLAVRKHQITQTTFAVAMPLLEHLDLPDSFNMALGPLRGCARLLSLTIGSADADDKAGGLASLVQLRKLSVEGVHRTLEPLATLVQLEELRISERTIVVSQATDLALLANLTRLRVLHVRGLPLTSVQALAHLRTLEELDLRHCHVADLRPLGKLTKLTRLRHICNEAATEFGFVRHLVALEELDLTHTHLRSTAVCADLLQLKKLRVQHSDEMARSVLALPRGQDIDVTLR